MLEQQQPSESLVSVQQYLLAEDSVDMKAGGLPLSSSPSAKGIAYADPRHANGNKIRNAMLRFVGTACLAIAIVYLARLGTTLTSIRSTVRRQGVELTGMAAQMHSAISDGTEDVRNQVTQHRDKLVSLETSWKMMEDETSTRQKKAEQQIATIEKKLAAIWEMKEAFNTKMQKVDADTKPVLTEFEKIKDMPSKLDENMQAIRKMREDMDLLKGLVDSVVQSLEQAKGGPIQGVARLREQFEGAKKLAHILPAQLPMVLPDKPSQSAADDAAQRLAEQVAALKQELAAKQGGQPQPQPEQKPEPKPEPQPQPEQKPEQKPEPQPEQKPEPQPEQQPEQKPEQTPAKKANGEEEDDDKATEGPSPDKPVEDEELLGVLDKEKSDKPETPEDIRRKATEEAIRKALAEAKQAEEAKKKEGGEKAKGDIEALLAEAQKKGDKA